MRQSRDDLTNRKTKSVDARLLRTLPLPIPGADGDKEARGQVLIVAGTRGMPGAAVLAGIAALRAGAGKLEIAAPDCIADFISFTVLESMVTALPESQAGVLDKNAFAEIKKSCTSARAVLIGPGMRSDAPAIKTLSGLCESVAECIMEQEPASRGTLVLDAASLKVLKAIPQLSRGGQCPLIITPHAGEMAQLLDIPKEQVCADPLQTALLCAQHFSAVTVLKGHPTFIVAPGGDAFHNKRGNIGLATSGSGDTLSGIVAGLAARGAHAVQAAVWGVHIHALAGETLSRRIGKLGFLARELLDQIPPLMEKASHQQKSSGKLRT